MRQFLIAILLLSTKFSFASPRKSIPITTYTWAAFSSQPAPVFFDVHSLLEHYRLNRRTWYFFAIQNRGFFYPRRGEPRPQIQAPPIRPARIIYTPGQEALFTFQNRQDLVRFFIQNPIPDRRIIERPFPLVAEVDDDDEALRNYIANITQPHEYEGYEQQGLARIVSLLIPALTPQQAQLLGANYLYLRDLFLRHDALLEGYPEDYGRQHMLRIFQAEFRRIGILEPQPLAIANRFPGRIGGSSGI